jgi:hypothetical protein
MARTCGAGFLSGLTSTFGRLAGRFRSGVRPLRRNTKGFDGHVIEQVDQSYGNTFLERTPF